MIRRGCANRKWVGNISSRTKGCLSNIAGRRDLARHCSQARGRWRRLDAETAEWTMMTNPAGASELTIRRHLLRPVEFTVDARAHLAVGQ
jgi:hypothetical protein